MYCVGIDYSLVFLTTVNLELVEGQCLAEDWHIRYSVNLGD